MQSIRWLDYRIATFICGLQSTPIDLNSWVGALSNQIIKRFDQHIMKVTPEL